MKEASQSIRTKFYAPSADGHIIALDVKRGKLIWNSSSTCPKREPIRAPTIIPVWTVLRSSLKARSIMGVKPGDHRYGGRLLHSGPGCPELRRSSAIPVRSHAPASPVVTAGRVKSWNERFGASVWTSGSYGTWIELDLIRNW